MEVDKHDYKVIQQAISNWEDKGLLSTDKALELRQSVSNGDTDRRQIAQYFFFIALFCILLAFGALFLNEKLLEKIKVYFSWNDLVISMISMLLSILWFWYTGYKRKNISTGAYEVYMVLGGLSVLTSLVYLCKELHIDKTYTAFLSMALPALLVLAPILRSKSLWIGTIVTAVAWFGSFSSWQGQNNLFWGMNYPVRFTVFGLVILGISLLQGKIKQIEYSQKITYLAGLLLFFTGLWAVSIFGNFNTLVGWQAVRQINVLIYSIVFGLCSALSFYLGIKFKDEAARDIGVLFLIINLYTRYFEYFWDTMNKGLFFLILAITFGFLGWWLERKKKGTKKEPLTNK